MAKFNEDWIDSADWIEEVCDYRPADSCITLQELDEIRLEHMPDGNYCDYPLSETDMLASDEDKKDKTYQLVRFLDEYDGQIFRWCEM